MPPRIIYYYQTFEPGLYNLFNKGNVVTHIHLASIHFGNDGNGNPYIHLNDNDPRDKMFDHVWEDLKIIKQYGTKVVLMVGGAGGGFNAFFFKLYPKLKFSSGTYQTEKRYYRWC